MKTMKEVALDAAVREAKDKGLSTVVIDRAHDRHFCDNVGVDYCASDVANQVRDAILDYSKK